MSLPCIVFVPGYWEGPGVWAKVAKSLQEDHGFSTATTTLISTGQSSPQNTSLEDDIAAVHAILQILVSKEREVVLVLHSASGYIGSAAIKGLSRKEQSLLGQKGGVTKIAFVTAAVIPEGTVTTPMPFFDVFVRVTRAYAGDCSDAIQDTHVMCKSPRDLLFNDLDETHAALWLEALQRQPRSGWDGPVIHGGWKDVPSHYLVCENDTLLPADWQRSFAATAGSTVDTCDAGHMPQISQPETVVQFICKAATSTSSG